MYQQRLWYSFFWETKRRKSVLVGSVREKLEQLINDAANEKGFEVGKRVIYPNAVYLELAVDPKVAPHSALAHIRARTSGALRSHFPELKKLPSLWTRDYAVYNQRLDESALGSLSHWLSEKKRNIRARHARRKSCQRSCLRRTRR